MNRPGKSGIALFLIIAIAALSIRLPQLSLRPMHGDEAIHAYKLGELLETGKYRYDRQQYHGPLLYYVSLIPARLAGQKSFKDLDEFTVRIVPVFFGVVLVCMPLLLKDALGRQAAIIASVLTALSPAFVFYSRYYIHEMLLACLSFGIIICGFCYARTKRTSWALLTGALVGLTHATKETCIIIFGSMLAALVLTVAANHKGKVLLSNIKGHLRLRDLILALLIAAAVSALFFSSFFTNPDGVWDSLAANKTYFERVRQDPLHIHPWYYYIDILTWVEGFEKLTWNEDIIVVLAVLGFIVALSRRGVSSVDFSLLRFIAFYTLVMTAAYSALPYKTPWCVLGFLHGMILLAGIGGAALIQASTDRWQKLLTWSLLALFGLLSPGVQAFLGSYRYYADTCNPYVYAHPTTDVFAVAQRVKDISHVHPDGNKMYIQVICPGGDYWPLPWYLRSFSKVGWWTEVDKNVESAPVIIASPKVQQELAEKLYELPPPGQRILYVPLFDRIIYLRPQVELLGFVRKDLSDSFQQHQAPLPPDESVERK
jgi:uncharacterized protein (TIGR03663 family)